MRYNKGNEYSPAAGKELCMHKESLLAYLNAKPELTQMVLRAGSDPDFLNTLFFIVRTERSTVRYSCTKTIRILSEQQPQAVYPYFDEIAAWLHNTNSFIKWDGILTLANLVAVDKENRFDLLYEEYLALIRGPQMITATNVAGNAWKLVQRGHSVANGLPVVTVNRTGQEDDPTGNTKGIRFWGRSFATGPQGELLTEFGKDEEGVRVVEIDLDRTEYVRRGWPFFRDRRIDAYGDILLRYGK